MIILSAVAAAGCTSKAAGAASPAPPPGGESNITVAALPAADLAGLYVAQNDGIFAARGLHVTIKKIASTQTVISAQLKGQVDVGVGSYVPYIEAEAAGGRFRILAEASTLAPDTRVLVTPKSSRLSSIANLAGQRIGFNGTNSIGTLLVDMLLKSNGVSPGSVSFVTDPGGFPAMPGHLQAGAWGAAYLGEPYVTKAEETYDDRALVDLDQGAMQDFPADGYIVTQAWAREHPQTASAFYRAVQEGQEIAATDAPRARQAIARSDDLPGSLTDVMALPRYPTGPVNESRMQRTASDMLEFGILGRKDAAAVNQGTLIRSMLG